MWKKIAIHVFACIEVCPREVIVHQIFVFMCAVGPLWK